MQKTWLEMTVSGKRPEGAGRSEAHLQVVTTAWSLSSLRHFSTLQRSVCSIVAGAEGVVRLWSEG